MKKRILQWFMVFVAMIAATACYLYFSLWIPNRKMVDLDWWSSTPEEAIRNNCHDVLSYRIGNHHDAYLWLATNGNQDSIPLLIRSLKWQFEPEEDGLMICTTRHCLDALKSLTGHDAGNRYSEWKEWWSSTGSKLPPEAFYPHVNVGELNE